MYGTFVQSTYEDKGKREVYVLLKKSSHATFGPREYRVQVSRVLDSDSDCTDIPDSKRQELFHTDSKFELSTKQSDAAAESESNYKSKGVTSPPLGPIGLVRPRVSFRLPWDILPPPWPPPLAPI